MDPTAEFTALLAEHRDRIYRICCCYVADREERDDVHQMALIHLWQGMKSFRGASSPGTWVYRVVVNTCLGHVRSEQRRQRRLAEAEHQPALWAAEPVAADEPGGGAGAVERLYACVHKLPPGERAVVSLYLEEASTNQIAEVLGMSEGNVRVRLHRARQNLKAIWEKTNDGPR